MKRYNEILILGASGSGKTTLTRSLSAPRYETEVDVVHRFTTRPTRADDDPREITSVDDADFFGKVGAGQIGYHYRKMYGPQHAEMYGFKGLEPENDQLRVYSATGSAIDRSSIFHMRALLSTAYVIVLQINTAERVRRMQARSPDLPDWQRTARVDRDAEVAIAARHDAQEIIRTDELNIEEAQIALHATIDRLLEERA